MTKDTTLRLAGCLAGLVWAIGAGCAPADAVPAEGTTRALLESDAELTCPGSYVCWSRCEPDLHDPPNRAGGVGGGTTGPVAALADCLLDRCARCDGLACAFDCSQDECSGAFTACLDSGRGCLAAFGAFLEAPLPASDGVPDAAGERCRTTCVALSALALRAAYTAYEACAAELCDPDAPDFTACVQYARAHWCPSQWIHCP